MMKFSNKNILFFKSLKYLIYHKQIKIINNENVYLMVNLVGALNKETNKLVLAKNADKQTEYICIGCKEDLIFKKGGGHSE
jgi:hypothetical protein